MVPSLQSERWEGWRAAWAPCNKIRWSPLITDKFGVWIRRSSLLWNFSVFHFLTARWAEVLFSPNLESGEQCMTLVVLSGLFSPRSLSSLVDLDLTPGKRDIRKPSSSLPYPTIGGVDESVHDHQKITNLRHGPSGQFCVFVEKSK